MIRFKEFLEGNGLWANIHARRKKGLRKLRPGEKGYPESLKTEDTIAAGFEGKKIKIKNVKVRMADGSMRSLPPGKSSSSDGGSGDGE